MIQIGPAVPPTPLAPHFVDAPARMDLLASILVCRLGIAHHGIGMIDEDAELTIEEAGVLRDMVYEAQLEAEARQEKGCSWATRPPM